MISTNTKFKLRDIDLNVEDNKKQPFFFIKKNKQILVFQIDSIN